MTEMIIAALLLFTNRAYLKPEEVQVPKVYLEQVR
jgi:hypothetical protein